jgi:hypothetical protein
MRDPVDFAEEVLGFKLWPRQAEILRQFPRHQELVLALGRRSGKSLLASIWAAYDAIFGNYEGCLRPDEPRYIVCVATNRDQAGIVYRNIRGFFNLPALAPLVVSETSEELWLGNNVCIRVLPCSSRAVRGLAISTIILDELAHFVDSEHGYQAGKMVHDALTPSLAQFRGKGKIIAISTPWGRLGIFWQLWQQAQEGLPGMAGFRYSTEDMNPTIDKAWLESQRLKNPDVFACEYEAEFLDAAAAFLPADAVRACVVRSEHTPYQQGMSYVLALDPAFTSDSFAFVVCHEERDNSERVVVDYIDRLEPPVSFVEACELAQQLSQAYGHARVVTDQYCAAPLVQALGEKGLRVALKPFDATRKQHVFASLSALIRAGRLELYPGPVVDELLRLERVLTPSGMRVEASSGHDDLATALAVAVHELASEKRRRLAVY